MCKELLKLFSRVEKEVACERGVCIAVGTKERPRANRPSSASVGVYLVLNTVSEGGGGEDPWHGSSPVRVCPHTRSKGCQP